jgi:hypothetical protein
MLGVPIEGPTNVYCDNKSVVKSLTRPESTLKKKHAAINYHRIREAQAAGGVHPQEPLPACIESTENLADALTKVLSARTEETLLTFKDPMVITSSSDTIGTSKVYETAGTH